MTGHRIEFIPIHQIEVVNPRTRNRKGHAEITNNIGAIGLKRPIKVGRFAKRDGEKRYALICGQGRVESFQALGETHIPAVVVDIPEHDGMVQGLVENIARRQHNAYELMAEVGSLKKRGYNDVQIGEKIGVTTSWVNMIGGLLDRGETRLVAAVETGLIPISFAVEIAKLDDAEAQEALAQAYEQGKIRGSKVSVVRRMLARRAKAGKGLVRSPYGRQPQRTITSDDLVKLYQQETDRQRVLIKKADFTQSRLLFVIEALKELMSNEAFKAILQAEQLETLPRGLTERMGFAR